MTRTNLILAALAFALAACSGGNQETAPDANAGAEDASALPDPLEITDWDVSLGAADAPVTIIEYASVVCPGCAAFHNDVFPAIKAKYVDTGLVRFVFREFPTEPREFMLIGSALARCAGERGGDEAYFAVIGELFRDQRGWIYAEDPKVQLAKIVSQVGMNEADIDACLKRQALVDNIVERAKTASSVLSVNSAPSFFLNGERVRPEKIEDFEELIEGELDKAP